MSRTHKVGAWRLAARWIVLGLFGMTFLVGCSESPVQESSMPTEEFVKKLEKEHPELFIKQLGKGKTEVLDGRDKRAIIRREWRKAQGG
jgi:hypothetical protein